MIALLRAELLRLRSRRLVKALAVLAALGMPTIVTILATQSHPGSSDAFSLGDAREFIEGTATLFVIAGWLIGASLVGAEWQAGTITTLLTWEPRRSRVLGTKTVAAAAGAFVFVLVSNLVFLGLLALVAVTRGSTDGLDASVFWFIVRISALASVGAILGLALATVTRNTAAALGIAFVYLAIVEGIIRGFRPGWRGWLLGDSSTEFALMHGGVPGRTFSHSAAVLAMWCIAFLTVAMVTFRARDVD